MILIPPNDFFAACCLLSKPGLQASTQHLSFTENSQYQPTTALEHELNLVKLCLKLHTIYVQRRGTGDYEFAEDIRESLHKQRKVPSKMVPMLTTMTEP